MDPFTISAIAGAATGAAGGIMDFQGEKKAQKKAEEEEKRRRRERKLAMIREAGQQGQQQKQAARGMLASAAFDWASAIR